MFLFFFIDSDSNIGFVKSNCMGEESDLVYKNAAFYS